MHCTVKKKKHVCFNQNKTNKTVVNAKCTTLDLIKENQRGLVKMFKVVYANCTSLMSMSWDCIFSLETVTETFGLGKEDEDWNILSGTRSCLHKKKNKEKVKKFFFKNKKKFRSVAVTQGALN